MTCATFPVVVAPHHLKTAGDMNLEKPNLWWISLPRFLLEGDKDEKNFLQRDHASHN